jgi:hypothetical protein
MRHAVCIHITSNRDVLFYNTHSPLGECVYIYTYTYTYTQQVIAVCC